MGAFASAFEIQYFCDQLGDFRRHAEVGSLYAIGIACDKDWRDADGYERLGLKGFGKSPEGSSEPPQHAVIAVAAEFIDLLATHTAAVGNGGKANGSGLDGGLRVEPRQKGLKSRTRPRCRRPVFLPTPRGRPG